MQLIYVNRPGTPIAPIRELQLTEIEALGQAMQGEASSTAQALIRSVWQQRWWFACSCRGPAASPPLLYVHRDGAGDLSLSTLRDRPAHSEACPFGRLPAIHGSCRDDRPGMPPLGNLLIRWFTAAKLNVVYPYVARDLLSQQYAGLREVARSLCIAPGRTLYDFSCTRADALPSLALQLQRSERDHPASHDQTDGEWGVLLAVVDTLVDGDLMIGDDVVQLNAQRIDTAAGIIEAGGPYAALLKVVVGPNGTVQPQHAFVQPVYSPHQLVPIDTAYERRTLKTLLRLQQKLLAEMDVLVVIRKTLPNTQAHDRGIAFHVHRLGPNGRPVRDIDVLSVDAAHQIRCPPSQPCPQDVVYHLVKQEALFHELDRRFFNITVARLLDGVNVRRRAQVVAT